MTNNYHQHDYGVGRAVSRAFWTGVVLIVAWWIVVLVMTSPWIMLATAMVLVLGGVCIAIIVTRRTRHE